MKSYESYEASKIVNNCTVEMDFDFEVNNIVDSLPCCCNTFYLLKLHF